MRAVLAALVVTAVVVVLLVSYDTRPPREPNSQSALRTPAPRRTASPRPRPHPHPPGSVTASGPLVATPFSSIQVQATMLHGRLIDVKTLSLTGSDKHTQALNARAEPILREEALKAGSADIDVVTGATYTSESWRDSLAAAIEAARVD